jgi:hypothetical protein
MRRDICGKLARNSPVDVYFAIHSLGTNLKPILSKAIVIMAIAVGRACLDLVQERSCRSIRCPWEGVSTASVDAKFLRARIFAWRLFSGEPNLPRRVDKAAEI